MLVTGDIAAVEGDENTPIAFKNCAPFRRCVTHINDKHAETAENLDIIMPMYNLLEYSDNYTGSSGNLWHFKRDKQNMNKENPADITTDGSSSFNTNQIFPKVLFLEMLLLMLILILLTMPIDYLLMQKQLFY